MKIVLCAFQGKLMSEVMDWPEDSSPRINMLMDMDTITPYQFNLRPFDCPTLPVMATFSLQSGALAINGQTARVYSLVGVSEKPVVRNRDLPEDPCRGDGTYPSGD